jgi:two-component system sensor histidine kinase BarA
VETMKNLEFWEYPHPNYNNQLAWILGPLIIGFRLILCYSSYIPSSSFLLQAADFTVTICLSYIKPWDKITGTPLQAYLIFHAVVVIQMQCYFLGHQFLVCLVGFLYMATYYGAVLTKGVSGKIITPIFIASTVMGPIWWGGFSVRDSILYNFPLMITIMSIQMTTGRVHTLLVDNLQKEREKMRIQSTAQVFKMASHELRNPLQALTYSVQYLSNLQLVDQAKETIDEIRTTTLLLNSLIENVLDFNLTDKKLAPLNNSDFSILDLVEKIGDIYKQTAKHKGVEMNLYVDPSIPVSICGDDVKLTQIISNLFYNAIKFTEKGTIDILVEKLETYPLMLKISVVDTGIGISKENCESLFKAYNRVNVNSREAVKGWGLGLAISQMIVQQMSGEIGVESEVGKGSTFWIKIPFTTYSKEVTSTLYPVDRTKKVVVSALHESTCSIIQRYLTKLGLESVQLYKEGMTLGLDTVVISDGYVTVDVPSHCTLSIVNLPVKLKKLQQLLKGREEFDTNPSQIVTKPVVIESREIKVLLIEDNKLISKMITKILNSNGILVDIAYNGKEGLDWISLNLPDVVIVDNYMPVMSGLEFIKIVRGSTKEQLKNIPVIMISGSGDEIMLNELKGLNASFIYKPVTPKDLMTKIRLVVGSDK